MDDQMTGIVMGYAGHGDYWLVKVGPKELHLQPWQLRSARAGDTVRLARRGPLGNWNWIVTEVLPRIEEK